MKRLTFISVLVLISLGSLKADEAKLDLCELKTKANGVLSAFKLAESRQAVQNFLVELQTALAIESQSLLEQETVKKWPVLKKLEADEEDSKHMQELGKLLNENDAKGKGFLYNLCGLSPKVAEIVGMMKSENQALIKDLFETLRLRVNEELPAVFEMVKNSNSELVNKISEAEPENFKGLSQMFGADL